MSLEQTLDGNIHKEFWFDFSCHTHLSLQSECPYLL